MNTLLIALTLAGLDASWGFAALVFGMSVIGSAAARLSRPKTAPPAPITERDRLAKEIAFETRQLSHLEELAEFGRGDQDEIDAKQHRIADLQARLTSLDMEQAEIDRIAHAQATQLPGDEDALNAAFQDFLDSVGQLQKKARGLQKQRDAIIEKYADLKNRQRGYTLVPMRNRELLPLTSDGGLCGQLLEGATTWLKQARAAGFVVPAEPVASAPIRRQHAPLKQDADMSTEERRVRQRTGTI